MIKRYQAPAYRSHLMRFIYDQEVVAKSTLAWISTEGSLPNAAAGFRTAAYYAEMRSE